MKLQTSAILFFFFNDTATTEIYTLSLHDALPILMSAACCVQRLRNYSRRSFSRPRTALRSGSSHSWPDRKSTRLNSSHMSTSYAVFCLKKKMSRRYGAHSDRQQDLPDRARPVSVC